MGLKFRATLAATFMVASATAMPQDESLPPPAAAAPEHTYWTYDDYRAVVDLWPCGDDSFCVKIHDLDPADPKIRQRVARLMKKDTGKVTPDDVHMFCGFTTEKLNDRKLDSAPDAGWPGHRSGKLVINRKDLITVSAAERKNGLTYKFEIESRDNGQTLRVTIEDAILFFPMTVELKRLANPPPACVSPAV